MAIALKRSWAFPVLLAIGATLYGIWSANYGPRYEENLKRCGTMKTASIIFAEFTLAVAIVFIVLLLVRSYG